MKLFTILLEGEDENKEYFIQFVLYVIKIKFVISFMGLLLSLDISCMFVSICNQLFMFNK